MTAIDLSAKPINGRLPVIQDTQPAPYTPPSPSTPLYNAPKDSFLQDFTRHNAAVGNEIFNAPSLGAGIGALGRNIAQGYGDIGGLLKQLSTDYVDNASRVAAGMKRGYTPPAKSVMTPDQEYLLSLIPGGGASYKEIVKKGGLSGEAFRRAGNAVVNFFHNAPERETNFIREALGREPKNPAPAAKPGAAASDISMFPQVPGFRLPISEDALQRMRGVADFANSAKQLYGQKQQAPTGVDFLRGLFQQKGPSPVDLVNKYYEGTQGWGSPWHVQDLIAAQTGQRADRGQKVDMLGQILGTLRSQLASNASLDAARISAGEQRNPKIQDAAALSQFYDPAGGLGPIIQQHPELGKAISNALVNTLGAANQSGQGQSAEPNNLDLASQLNMLMASPIFQSMLGQQPVEKKAGGGEVGGGEAGAVPLDKAPVQEMDSGDYVIPVEVKRYFGSKFFQDLIEKADNAGLQQ
jgi:hypothetical protein